ncbi:hypothetical protein C8F01DRAFT_1153163 [Mycena amicta]|nr:hypothetical protein C8F01DRAFT_1153163 [Mycena amicta]
MHGSRSIPGVSSRMQFVSSILGTIFEQRSPPSSSVFLTASCCTTPVRSRRDDVARGAASPLITLTFAFMSFTAPPSLANTRQWVDPPPLPEWLVPVESEPTPITPQSVEKEPPPPIPSQLVGREYLYGFIITEELVEVHSALEPSTTPHYRRREITHSAFYNVARRLGLAVYIDEPRGHDDIAWFSYTKGGIVRVKQIPIASSIERFAMELGIEEKPQWHNAWVNYQQ